MLPQNTVDLKNKQNAFLSVHTEIRCVIIIACVDMLVLALISVVFVLAVAELWKHSPQLGVYRLILLYTGCLLKLIADSEVHVSVF